MKAIKSILINKLENNLSSFFALCMILFLVQQLSANVISENNSMHANAQQQKTIVLIGKVINLEEFVLDGVIILNNSTDSSTVTDEKGKFKLTLDEPSLVSFIKIGYKTLDYTFSESDSSLVVILSPESNEVIVHSFDSIKNIKNNTKITINSSDSIGVDSLETLHNPLYIIDDVQLETGYGLENLDAKNIKSISVLKSKTAIELYGNRGKNGVVIITTIPKYTMERLKSTKMSNIDTTTVIKKKVE